jgi:hypothetical protein
VMVPGFALEDAQLWRTIVGFGFDGRCSGLGGRGVCLGCWSDRLAASLGPTRRSLPCCQVSQRIGGHSTRQQHRVRTCGLLLHEGAVLYVRVEGLEVGRKSVLGVVGELNGLIALNTSKIK